MALILSNLGYGNTQLVEQETVTRILTGQFYETEEVRIDRPSDFNNSFEYVAVAPANTSTGALSWYCIRVSWVNNRKVRMQFRENIAWDQRALGWS